MPDSRPDLVLLVGGTDGGNADGGAAGARGAGRGGLARAGRGGRQRRRARRGRRDSSAGGVPYVVADNVVPRIGVLAPGAARAAIREMFLRHVIGGKHLSAIARSSRGWSADRRPTWCSPASSCSLGRRRRGRRRRRRRWSTSAAPPPTCTRVVELDPEDAGLARQVVGHDPVTRTVEGDLGMRWSAVPTVVAMARART